MCLKNNFYEMKDFGLQLWPESEFELSFGLTQSKPQRS